MYHIMPLYTLIFILYMHVCLYDAVAAIIGKGVQEFPFRKETFITSNSKAKALLNWKPKHIITGFSFIIYCLLTLLYLNLCNL